MTQNLFSRRRQTKRKQKNKRHHNDFFDTEQEQSPDRMLEIVSLSHEGRGVAKFNGKTQFVDGALPGETVRAECLTTHTSYDELKALDILKASEDRIEPFCPHFSVCGGCSLQYMRPASQLAHKQKVLREQLTHFGQLTVKQWLKPIMSEHTGYRSKARLGVYYDSSLNRLIIGFREKRSKSLTPISQCPILRPELARLVPLLPEMLASLSNSQSVTHIELAEGDDTQAIVIRHIQVFPEKDKAYLKAFSERHHVTVYTQGQTDKTAVNLLQKDATLRYTIELEQPSRCITLDFHPQDFTQVNSKVNQALVTQALKLLELSPAERALDLFCGLGNFTLPMAMQCASVTGVEGVQDMVARATENARRNGIDNAQFYKADLFSDFRSAAWAKQSYDKILIDPPRAGALAVMNFLPHFNAARIVYISCNPATLARDAGILAKHGYRLDKAGVMDMFPNTSHVEAIAVFVR
jgi:23S rRNA (uracil1939-C5)-methyltransferase